GDGRRHLDPPGHALGLRRPAAGALDGPRRGADAGRADRRAGGAAVVDAAALPHRLPGVHSPSPLTTRLDVAGSEKTREKVTRRRSEPFAPCPISGAPWVATAGGSPPRQRQPWRREGGPGPSP